MEKIKKKSDGTLFVPDKPVIPFITGDGVGREITPVMIDIVNAAVEKNYGKTRAIEWKEVWAGQAAYDRCGVWMPDETIEAFKEYLVGIKGPLTTPVGEGIRSLNVALRQAIQRIYMPV